MAASWPWQLGREECGLGKRLQGQPAPDPPTHHQGKRLRALGGRTQLLQCFPTGGVCLTDAERLDEDEPFQASLGMKQLPDQIRIGEWSRDTSQPGWPALRRLRRHFVPWTLARAEPGRSPPSSRTEGFFR